MRFRIKFPPGALQFWAVVYLFWFLFFLFLAHRSVP